MPRDNSIKTTNEGEIIPPKMTVASLQVNSTVRVCVFGEAENWSRVVFNSKSHYFLLVIYSRQVTNGTQTTISLQDVPQKNRFNEM